MEDVQIFPQEVLFAEDILNLAAFSANYACYRQFHTGQEWFRIVDQDQIGFVSNGGPIAHPTIIDNPRTFKDFGKSIRHLVFQQIGLNQKAGLPNNIWVIFSNLQLC